MFAGCSAIVAMMTGCSTQRYEASNSDDSEKRMKSSRRKKVARDWRKRGERWLFRSQGGFKLGPGRRATEIGKDQRARDIDNGQQTKKRRGCLEKRGRGKQKLLAAWRSTIKSGQNGDDDSSDKWERDENGGRERERGRKGRWGEGTRNEGPGAAGASGAGRHSDQVRSSTPGIETRPHAVSVLARPSAESARPPTLRTALIGWWQQ